MGDGKMGADFDILAAENEEGFAAEEDRAGGGEAGGERFQNFAVASGARRLSGGTGGGNAAGRSRMSCSKPDLV